MWRRAVKTYSYLVPGLWAFVALGLLALNLRQADVFMVSTSAMVGRFIVPAVIGIGLIAVLCARATTRLIVANTLGGITVLLYAHEIWLARDIAQDQRAAAQASGSRFDARDKLTVIRDMRAAGQEAYPIMRAGNMLAKGTDGDLKPILSSDGKPLLPMASIPRATVVSCNELGTWQIYESDRHGFNNPDTQWNGTPSVMMVGDSFVHGSCVPKGADMASRLRPEFGRVLNLGVGGFGPLLELAALQEYAAPLKPATVVWVFFEGNDLNIDLPREERSRFLLGYLRDPAFSQNLIERGGEIAGAMRAHLDGAMVEAMQRVDDPRELMASYLSLNRTREEIGIGTAEMGYNPGDLDEELPLFETIIAAARDRVAAWGGQFYLVYLPASERYEARLGEGAVRQRIYRDVQEIAARQRIPLIDVAGAFARESDPERLYAFPGGHMNPEGYQKAAEIIAAALRGAKVSSLGGSGAEKRPPG